MTRHTVQLPDELYERLTNFALEAGKSPDDLIVKAIEELIEDFEDVRLADQVLGARASGQSSTYSLDIVSRKLGLDD